MINSIHSLKKNRDSNIKINIILSFAFKILSIGISFLLIPMTINYLNSEQYGIWLTLLSILSWVSFSDIGLGNGLRNKLTEALSKDNIEEAREYISTAYAALATIVSVLFIILMVVIPLLDWQKIFNTTTLDNTKLIKLNIVVFTFFLGNFVLSLYNQLYYATQQSSITGIGQILLNTISLISIIILKKISYGNIIYLSLSYGLSLVIPSIILTYLFFFNNRNLIPKIKYVKVNKVKDILGLGVKFFVIQIAAVVFFSTSNIIITQVSGPKEVTTYNVVYKLFSAITLAHTILVTPLWSAYTEAYINGDINWIKKMLKYLNLLLIPIVLALILMIVFSQVIFKIWVGNKVLIPNSLVISMALYTFLVVWGNIYSYFLNGVNKIEIQMYVSIIVTIVFIPLSIYLSKNFNLGTMGVIIAQILTSIPFAIIGPIQTYTILKNKLITTNVKQGDKI